MFSFFYTFLGFAACGLYIGLKHRHRKAFPPGPRPLPLIGNLLDVPAAKQWITYTKWKQQYGDITYINVLGKHIVVLNSLKAANEILEKRSAKTSGRPYSVMMLELMGLSWFITRGYTTFWRTHRRLFHSYFNETAAPNLRPAQERAVNHLLHRLLEEPDGFMDHIRLQSAEVIMDVVYDVRVKDHSNVFVQTSEKAVLAFAQAAMPGRFLVDSFPSLKYVPAWFPGAQFKRIGAQWNVWIKAAIELPFQYVKENMQNGTAGPSMLSFLIEKCEANEDGSNEESGLSGENLAKTVAVNAYAAGSDTTLSAIQTFFLLMANHPEYQRAAQAELDMVLGDVRLPTYDDMKDLPYISALVKELLRWHPVLPAGVPHCLDEDDEYEGYFLPKGTVIVGNTWAILRDPEIYPDPDAFNPQRWLLKTEKGFVLNDAVPESLAPYGYGRRICPGRFFANDSLMLTIASVLTCFSLSPLDSNGKPAKSVPENFTDQLIIYPLPFKLSITPRSKAIAQLIQVTDP